MTSIKKAYGLTSGLEDVFPQPIIAKRDPTTGDKRYPIGQTWVNTSSNQSWMLTSIVTGSATWSLSSPGSSDVDTINSLSPVLGNIVIDGGTNITDVNAGNTVTLNLDNAITLATSVTSPIYTAAAGLAINSAAANNITIKMGDAVGANKISFTDSAAAEQASLDSDGTLTVVNMDGIIGATTPAAGTFTTVTGNTSVVSPIFTSTGAVDTNINSVAGQDILIKMGDAAGANKISFTDSAAAEQASLDSDGTLTVVNMDGIIGATTPAAGTFTTATGNTSVVSPIFTAPAATDVAINSIAGQDILIKMGDAAGANKISFIDSAAAEQAKLDSDGTLTVANMDGIIGATTPAAGTFTTATGNTSLVSPIVTAPAATDLAINSIAGQNILVKLGDNAAANKISFIDSDSNEVAAIDSNGGFSMGAITFAGLLTASASATIETAGAALNLGSDNDAGAVNLGVGTTARAIGIGNSAAAHTITIGSVTGAASLDLRAGTGNFTLEGDVATTYNISATGANTGTITIGGGTGAQTLNLMAGGTGIKTVNIGTGAIDNVVTIGTVTGAASLDLKCGTGNFTLEGNVASTYDISNTGVNTGTVNIAGGTGARTINIGAGGTGAKTINIGAAASADLITIGTADGAGSLDLKCGTGNFTLEGNVATTYNISATGANTGTITISGGTGAQTTNIATGGTGIKTVNIGTGAIDNVVTIGTVTGAASLDLKCGTGNFTLEGDVASTYEISSTGANTGTCKFASGTGARTVEIAGGGTGVKTINIGAAATADIITIGTTTGAGSLTLAAGTGDITVSGTVKEIDAEFLYASGTDLTVSQSPILQSNLTTGAVPSGATGDVNLMYMQDGCLMEQFILGAGQTIIAPRMTANGLNIALDQAEDEGAEYNFGMRSNAKHVYTIGTDAAFFAEATIYLEDISGCEPLLVGFRKVEANDADYTNYTDFYALGMNNVTSETNVIVAGRLNSGGITLQDTTDAWGGDTSAQTLKIMVSAGGVITAEIGGVAVSNPLAQTFDNGDQVAFFIHFLHHGDLAGEIGLQNLKIGYQA